jgi:hypothetical protein
VEETLGSWEWAVALGRDSHSVQNDGVGREGDWEEG